MITKKDKTNSKESLFISGILNSVKLRYIQNDNTYDQ